MADSSYTTTPMPFPSISFAGGFNTAGGPFALSEEESPDLQNIDLDVFGSILKRNGYLNLTSASLGAMNSDGLHWYESESKRELLNVIDGKLYKMDTVSGVPDGDWDDITGDDTITADNFCDFVNWRNKCFITNGTDTPLAYDGTTLTTATLPTNVTRPKFVEQFENYLFYLNVYVSSTKEGSRFYWCDINDETTWDAANFIRVSDRDGQEITGARRLSDRLVLFKDRSIYNVFATFDPDIPFTVQKSNSAVGCVASDTIQEIENGLVFQSQDGFYFYDGNNSTKISDKISPSLIGSSLATARSTTQKSKNRYICYIVDPDGEDIVFIWDYALNAWTIYRDMNISAIETAFIDGKTEYIYFCDSSGYVYRMDTGRNDFPLGEETAIDAYYYTNWKPFSDIVALKSVPMVVLYHTIDNSTVRFTYSYDFNEDDQYYEDVDMSGEVGLVWDEGNWDEVAWDAVGGMLTVKNIEGRGRVMRFGFKNSTLNETFRIDGIGVYARGETYKA